MSTVDTTEDGLATGMRLLEAGIPLSLLLDLAIGPHSHDLYDGEEADISWLPAHAQNRQLAG